MTGIGEKIKRIMKERDIWDFEVGYGTGLLRNNVSTILGPRGNPTWKTIKRILDFLGYEVVLKKKGNGGPA
jgi:DNA-binding phage protein